MVKTFFKDLVNNFVFLSEEASQSSSNAGVSQVGCKDASGKL